MGTVTPFRRGRRPSGLSTEARRLYDAVLADYELEHDGVALHMLGELASIVDQIREVQQQIRTEGRTVPGSRRGTIRPHPLLRVEAEYRRQWLSIARMLNLDLSPPE